ncbi:MAG TPA: ATP-binding protein, partial [Saprospiraceae bacterium]|nr:ATP-binding protein [Saprospiraceae bacterium]
MKILKRKKYLDRISPFVEKPMIKVLTGQRRVGKSFLLQSISEELLDEDVQKIFVDKENFEFDEILNYQQLNQYINSKINSTKVAILIDEVQEIEEFEKSLRNFYKKPGFDIYITGSNANLLSGELASLLGGRYVEFEIFPLDFREFLELHAFDSTEENLNKYMQFGGMAGLSLLPDDIRIKREYLQNILNSIVYKDIIKRNQIRNVAFLENLISFIAGNVGSQFSSKKISDYLKSQKIKISINTVMDYLKFMADAFIFRKVKRIDIKGKKVFEIGEKYYFEDLGLRNLIAGFSADDISKVYENLVYNHLNSNGFEVKTGALGGKEIDFIAEKEGETYYFQVTFLLSNDQTIEREFGNLLLIDDNYPKYVISKDILPSINTYKG